MSDFEILEIGEPNSWADFTGGFVPATIREGRRVVDHEMSCEFIGMTANSMKPGVGVDYWHSHSQIEEIYIFFSGTGLMALDKELVPVKAGSVVRVGTGVMRAWSCKPDSKENLTWLCIRAGGEKLEKYPSDATKDQTTPLPW